MYYFALFVNLSSDTHWAWDSVRGSSCPYHSAVATLASPREHLLKICLENFHFLNLVLQLSLSLCEDLFAHITVQLTLWPPKRGSSILFHHWVRIRQTRTSLKRQFSPKRPEAGQIFILRLKFGQNKDHMASSK